MRITFDGTPNKLTLKECRKALQFFGPLVFPKREDVGLPLLVKFVPGLLKTDDCKGGTDWVEADADLFYIELDDNMSPKETLKCLAHELVHVKQMRLGELIDSGPITFVYNKKRFSTTKIDYFDLPYEIEAYGREVGLYNRYYDKFIKPRRKR